MHRYSRNLNLVILFTLLSIVSKSQEANQIIVGAPFLTITPDARSAGFGDQGVATTADNNSQFWNAAKYTTAAYQSGVSYTYTPWMKNVADNINLHSIAGFYKFDDKQAVSASLRYFSLGDINFTDDNGNLTTNAKPNEFAIDAAYSRKLSATLSAAVTFRFLRSDLTGSSSIPNVGGTSTIESKAATSAAADIALYYSKKFTGHNEFAIGLSISNIGPKISYSSDADKVNIPTNLKLGTRYTFDAGENCTVAALLETSKLLVPTPDYDKNGINKNADKTVLEGMFSSFCDASDGFSEELKEFTYSIGTEVNIYNTILARAGYFHESETKGNRQFFTFGVGGKYKMAVIDLAYLVPSTTGKNNPLDNTFRFSVGLNF